MSQMYVLGLRVPSPPPVVEARGQKGEEGGVLVEQAIQVQADTPGGFFLRLAG